MLLNKFLLWLQGINEKYETLFWVKNFIVCIFVVDFKSLAKTIRS